MELLDCMREIVAFFLLIQWSTSDNSSLGIVIHKEWFENHKSNPSPLHELSAELSESQTSIIIRWSINIDSKLTSCAILCTSSICTHIKYKVKLILIKWNADIYSVLHGDKIVVTFNTSLVADRHTILLTNSTYLPLRTVGGKGVYRSALDIGVGCMMALLFVLLCCCIMCQTFRWIRGMRRAASVRVLLVYPAVDSVFQRSVMLLAESLQSRGGIHVVIDMWERGSLAEQGPLRWLNTQADLSERVLLISPPQCTHTDNLKSKLVPGMRDDTVSASASNLFALALNLVTSAAHDPHGRDKFWVINLGHDEKSVQTELRGCRMFVLPRDLKKLHRQLLSGAVQSPALLRCFYCKNTLEQLEVNTDPPSNEKSWFLLC
uniref:SEFIR domain-containing protein n=1 Tax=Cyprinus carpio TaxID=7962 RepID=A0A8C1S2M8_CYPCA